MNFNLLWSAASGAAVVAALCLPVAAQAQVRSFNIAAQSASGGVRELAQQAGIQITLSGRDGRGRRTNAVSGNLDIREALDRLLEGTGLAIRSFDGKVAILGAAREGLAATDGEELVVTGSRIVRPEVESAMPVSVVRFEQAEKLGLITAYDTLLREPAVAPGTGPQNNIGSIDAGTASISLRNMGTNRTLTLVDGRRRVSGSGRSSAVDLNMIPVGTIDRIEIVTGGAAAVYGADAVTGAVNIITKKLVDGIELTATQGISEKGDSFNIAISGSGGGAFASGRGSVSIGGTYMKRNGLDNHDRDFAKTRVVYNENPANTGANDGIPDQLIYPDYGEFYYQFYPTFVINNTNYGYQNGATRELYVKTPLRPRGEFYGGDGGGVSDIGNLNEGNPLRTPLEQFAITTRLNYDVTDNIESIMRFDFGRTHYVSPLTYYREDSRSIFMNGAGSPWAYLDNPYLPASVRQMMLDNGLKQLRISRSYKEWSMYKDIEDRTSFTFSETLTGKLAGRLKWEAFYQYGRTKSEMEFEDTPRASRWLVARDVIADPVTGKPVCRDAAARAQGCVPYNIFSVDAPTPEQRAWLFESRRAGRENTQQLFGGSIVGPIYALPAGDVSIAVGAEHRRESLMTFDDPLALSGELVHGVLWTKQPNLSASFKVSEIYGEVVAPILRDVPFANRLEVEGAYRLSDYSTVGTTHAWKVAGTWSPLAGLSFRGVRSRSVRTPNFGELFEAATITEANLADPCETPVYYASPTRTANCRALGILNPGGNSNDPTTVTSGGNPDLLPETSNSLTLGVVLQPRFLRGLDIAVDYWSIDIDNVVTTFTGDTILAYCVDLPSLDNPFCKQITRDPNDPIRSIRSVSTQTINASRMQTRGIDLSLGYQTRFLGGRLNTDLKATYLLKKETQAVPGIDASIVKAMSSFTDPRFHGSLFVNYSRDRWDIAFNGRVIGAAIVNPNVSREAYGHDKIPAIFYGDLSIGFQPTSKLRLTLGVNNILDTEPPFNPRTYLGAGGYYDVVGRSYFLSAKTNF